ncbi:MAG: chromate transporter [Clostridia bacterium]|nr:chromate transporter [Clostridia bacterium]
MLELLEIFLTFLKIGAVSFGGGYAMIPLVTDEVIAHGWMSYDQLMNFIAVAESTPGPIAINMATFIGATRGGVIISGFLGNILGALLATFGVVLPSFIIILVIATIIKGLLQFAGVKAFLNGLRPVVVGLITATGILLFITVILGVNTIYGEIKFDWLALIIFTVITVLYYTYKRITKKTLSPILLIIISAILGILLYGVI